MLYCRSVFPLHNLNGVSVIPAEHPVAPPVRTGRPHLTRTAVILVLIAAVLATTASAVLSLLPSNRAELPGDVLRPTWYVENNSTPQGSVPPVPPSTGSGR